MVADVIEQQHTFFDTANRIVKTVFDLFGQARQQRVGGKGRPCVAAKPHALSFL